jgi:hypothetical protein
LRSVSGEGREIVAFEDFLKTDSEFIPLRFRGKFVLGLDLGRGELIEELLAELKEFVSRGLRARRRNRRWCSQKRGG